jgi:alpha-L-fucosidase 2
MHHFSGLQALAAVLLAWPISRGVCGPCKPQKTARIWDTAAAIHYDDSYVIGNGRLGAAIGGAMSASLPGGPVTETIPINEDSYWSGGPMYRVNPDAAATVGNMQSLISQNRIPEAARLGGFGYAGTPVSTRHYEALGDIELQLNHSAGFSQYQRWLDLSDATTVVSYVHDNVAYQREYIASNPDGVIAIRLTANATGNVSFNAHLRKGQGGSLNRWEDYSTKVGQDTIVMGGGRAGETGIEFAAGLKVVATGGRVYTLGDFVLCDGADAATIYVSAWTTFRKPDPKAAALADLEKAAKSSYQDVRNRHVQDYQKYAQRFDLSLGTSTPDQRNMTTARRFQTMNSTGVFDPELASLYMSFGRYLLIATSREGTLPTNLQGIWNQALDPMWGSKYPININLRESSHALGGQ